MRLYIPTTSTLMERLLVDGQIAITHGFAITPALREWYEADDEEELEYVASLAAARHSLSMLAEDPSAKRRRAVLAIEVDSISPIGEGDRAAVEVISPLLLSNVDSALIDSIEAQADIEVALASWGKNDEDAHFAREQASSHELLWFAHQELPFIF